MTDLRMDTTMVQHDGGFRTYKVRTGFVVSWNEQWLDGQFPSRESALKSARAQVSETGTEPDLTWRQFALDYAEASGVSIDFIADQGWIVAPCNCDEAGCGNWQMANQSQVEFLLLTGRAETGDLHLLTELKTGT